MMLHVASGGGKSMSFLVWSILLANANAGIKFLLLIDHCECTPSAHGLHKIPHSHGKGMGLATSMLPYDGRPEFLWEFCGGL